jgi:ABC-3C biological conflict system middle component
MNKTFDRETRLFNTPLEIGLRALFILGHFFPKALSIETIIYLDYFAIHSGDLKQGPKSLHPKYPFRSSELVVKREILQKGLSLLVSKELIQVQLRNEGIFYIITDIGKHVQTLFDSKYSTQLASMSKWLNERFGTSTESELADIVSANIEKWGGEFSNESKFRGNH